MSSSKTAGIDIKKLKQLAASHSQYPTQIKRIVYENRSPKCVDDAVQDLLKKLKTNKGRATVIYGEPQSGKTEMMICLTAALLDEGHRVIVHLLNDNIDLLGQNFGRFQRAGLSPMPVNLASISHPLGGDAQAIVFCKKNGKDLTKLLDQLSKIKNLVVIDDEADYATPNAKVNKVDAKGQKVKTPINKLIEQLLGKHGSYIGVTATPARLNLNNTFDTKTDEWVEFEAHAAYTGQDQFFPMVLGNLPYRLNRLTAPVTVTDARNAFARFLITVAYLNTVAKSPSAPEKNYGFLVHTSGRTDDHSADLDAIEEMKQGLADSEHQEFVRLMNLLFGVAQSLYPKEDPQKLVAYVALNANRTSLRLLNRARDKSLKSDPEPTSPFSVFFGGNLVSRGVTFPSLLAMFFSRDVKHKLQQDTYIQRARMFGGDRKGYLAHFELTIPGDLYDRWHRCFVFHRLALDSIKSNQLAPVWIGDARISVAQPSSIDKTTVNLDKGEMSYRKFAINIQKIAKLDATVDNDPESIETLKALAKEIGKGLPPYLIDYISADLKADPGKLVIHPASSIAGQSDADVGEIERSKGFMGRSQLELKRFGERKHHIKIFHNGKEARVFYKNTSGVTFTQNQ